LYAQSCIGTTSYSDHTEIFHNHLSGTCRKQEITPMPRQAADLTEGTPSLTALICKSFEGALYELEKKNK